MTRPDYELLIGLEVHVQLATASKLFCRCSTQFGQPPNTLTCPVCLGLPGALPVLNQRALELALKTALALHCTIPTVTKWDRKQYYYPDLPKGYQISQYDQPLATHGWLEIEGQGGQSEQGGGEQQGPQRIGILRAHLEEDAGKSMHDEQAGLADSRIDLNRTGTPLLEIVTAPDLRSPEQAKTFLSELKLLLWYLQVSDCNMQEGSLRVDANVNLRISTPQGKVYTPIVEVKNMNSFRAVERALAYEAQRQYTHWQQTQLRKGDIPKQTRAWDDQRECTLPMRGKEESSDYRYFPDPDLAPIRIDARQIEALRASLGESPSQLRDRLRRDHGLSAYEADVLVHQGRSIVDYYLAVAQACGEPKQAANWVQRDVLRRLKDEPQAAADELPVSPSELGTLIRAVVAGDLESSRSRDVFAYMWEHRATYGAALARMGIERVDAAEVESLCRELLQAHPQIVRDVRGGNEKAVNSLIGQAKKRNPNIDPNQFRALCLRLIREMQSPAP